MVVAALLQSDVANAAGKEDHERLRKSYENRTAELLKPVRVELERQLTELQTSLAKSGEAGAATAIIDARIEFGLSGTRAEKLTTFPLDVGEFGDRFPKHKDTVVNLRDRFDAKVSDVLAAPRRKYAGALASLARTLAREGKLDLAKQVEIEKTEIETAVAWKRTKLTVPPDAVEFRGHYYLLNLDALDWLAARKRCEKMGGHLVTISDAEENAFVEELCGGSDAWFGGTDAHKEGDWQWVTGEEMNFTDWLKGEPNNKYENENALAFYPKRRAWNDRVATEKTRFVCEWEPR